MCIVILKITHSISYKFYINAILGKVVNEHIANWSNEQKISLDTNSKPYSIVENKQESGSRLIVVCTYTL
jgi:hypothetical protein